MIIMKKGNIILICSIIVIILAVYSVATTVIILNQEEEMKDMENAIELSFEYSEMYIQQNVYCLKLLDMDYDTFWEKYIRTLE